VKDPEKWTRPTGATDGRTDGRRRKPAAKCGGAPSVPWLAFFKAGRSPRAAGNGGLGGSARRHTHTHTHAHKRGGGIRARESESNGRGVGGNSLPPLALSRLPSSSSPSIAHFVALTFAPGDRRVRGLAARHTHHVSLDCVPAKGISAPRSPPPFSYYLSRLRKLPEREREERCRRRQRGGRTEGGIP